MPQLDNLQPNNRSDNRLPIAQLYPQLTPEQQLEAEYFLTQFLEILRRIEEEEEN